MTTRTALNLAAFEATVTAAFFVRNAVVILALTAFALIALANG